MIYGHLLGGLGNQLFIYSFCKNLVDRTNQEACLYFDSQDGRQLEIANRFNDKRIYVIEEPFENVKDKPLYRKYNFSCKIMEHIPRCIQSLAMLIANCFGVIPLLDSNARIFYNVLKKRKNIIFMGYAQCEDYFKNIAVELKKEYCEAFKTEEVSVKLMKNSVCLHIRRGDFLDSKHRETFFVCKSDYYQKAVEKIASQVDNPHFYVFSDDIEWVKNHSDYLRNHNATYIENGGDNEVVEDFSLMISCNHYIISNSTLSWWAQYLGSYADKIVIAPSRWGNGKNNNRKIYQSNWILIEV